ncbi:DKNYY domain-containing protein [uncultured Elizabethkingia sp.]|uniref:DKNYY domain-containing protein n=1 Tax=uncultured Elizabethkingia sp. TaxID=432638 RepID=UPI0025935E9D|nr:DKNYY domain-containing protein [uncultured Elizabethkingia sp.]
MKKYTFFLAFVLMSFCISCKEYFVGKPVDKQKSGSYFIDSKRKIVYCQGGSWFGVGTAHMDYADPKSFEVLAEDIAKDKDSVYFRNMTQKLVDRNSFYVDNEIPKDRLHVYYIDQTLGFGIIKGADPKTYELVKDHINWARDKDHYFYADRIINADRNTFAFINDYFLKDKDSVYVSPNIGKFKSILPNHGNVEAINKQYIRIGNTIYFPPFRQDSGVVTSSFDKIDKIRVINQDIIGINNSTILSRGKKFKYDQVDVNSFQLFPIDKKNSVYADNPYSKDKNNVYYDEEVIPSADVKSFILMDNNFGKDAKNAYYKNELLKEVDAPSFKKEGDFYKDKLGNKFSGITGNKV